MTDRLLFAAFFVAAPILLFLTLIVLALLDVFTPTPSPRPRPHSICTAGYDGCGYPPRPYLPKSGISSEPPQPRP